jgi:hypothetical protein
MKADIQSGKGLYLPDLSWCPLIKKKQSGKPLGTVEEDMARVISLPCVPIGTLRAEEGYASSLLNQAYRTVHPLQTSPTRSEPISPPFQLNQTQADAIWTFEHMGGVFGSIYVGKGKTFITLLCGHIAVQRRQHERVVLLVPPEVLSQLLKRDLPEAQQKLDLAGTAFYPVIGSAEKRLAVAGLAAPGVYIMAYSTISTFTGQQVLAAIGATCYILDEAHRVARPSSARTKRLFSVIRAKEEQLQKEPPPDTSVPHAVIPGTDREAPTWRYAPARVEMVALSGTVTKKSIGDYAHLARQCLHEGSPLPTHHSSIMEWSDVIDANKCSTSISESTFRNLVTWAKNTGGLTTKPEVPLTQQEILREAHSHRLNTAPGVVATIGQEVGSSLVMHWREPRMPDDDTGKRVQELMRDVIEKDVTPSGDEIDYALHKWKWCWELSTGFYNELVWPTPEQVVATHMRAGRGKVVSIREAEDLIGQAIAQNKLLQRYHGILRRFLDAQHIPYCDTPALVAAEIVRQIGKDGVPGTVKYRLPRELFAAYKAARDAWYDDLPERLSKPVRICDYKVLAAVQWCKERVEKKEGGIIWFHHPAIGQWLCEYLKREGVPHTYAPSGDKGNEAVFNTGLVVASFSHGVGKNLQHQCKQLFLEVRREATVLEQTLGRTHRQGQKADEVHADIFLSNGFDIALFNAILHDADYIQSSVGQQQKLCYSVYDPIVPPTDSRLFQKLGLIQNPVEAMRIRGYDQITDNKTVADLCMRAAYSSVSLDVREL